MFEDLESGKEKVGERKCAQQTQAHSRLLARSKSSTQTIQLVIMLPMARKTDRTLECGVCAERQPGEEGTAAFERMS